MSVLSKRPKKIQPSAISAHMSSEEFLLCKREPFTELTQWYVPEQDLKLCDCSYLLLPRRIFGCC